MSIEVDESFVIELVTLVLEEEEWYLIVLLLLLLLLTEELELWDELLEP